jgi:protein-disulfide isomerase
MRPTLKRFLAALSLGGLIALNPPTTVDAFAEPAAMERSELDAHIRDFIMKNPRVIREALQNLEAEEEIERTKTILRSFKDKLYGGGSPEIGRADAKVSIVEFFDYNCPYCRATYSQLKDFIKDNPDTKIILKDIASLGADSEKVSRIVIAARKQGEIVALHDALMSRKGKVTEAQAIETAAKLGFDVERLKTDARSSETGDVLTRAQDLATQLNVSATPLYIVGHNGIAGAPDDLIAQITKHADEIRKSGCDVC